MVVAYWIVAGVPALFYLYAGGKKATQRPEQLAPMMGWVDTIPMPVVRAIGIVELLGVAGLVLPPLTGVAPALAVAAATGFVVLQIPATALHLARGEANVIGLNIVLLALAAVATWLATAL